LLSISKKTGGGVGTKTAAAALRFKLRAQINRPSVYILGSYRKEYTPRLRYTVERTNRSSEISGSHGGEHEDGCLLGCCAVQSGRSLQTFQRYLLPPSSRLAQMFVEHCSPHHGPRTPYVSLQISEVYSLLMSVWCSKEEALIPWESSFIKGGLYHSVRFPST
jgi:hypothetical protein